MKKLYCGIVIIVLLCAFNTVNALEWTNICKNENTTYCENIGKGAYMRGAVVEQEMGIITGVAWKLKGSLVRVSKAIPAANIKETLYLAPADLHYYIIKSHYVDREFIEQCNKIKVK